MYFEKDRRWFQQEYAMVPACLETRDFQRLRQVTFRSCELEEGTKTRVRPYCLTVIFLGEISHLSTSSSYFDRYLYPSLGIPYVQSNLSTEILFEVISTCFFCRSQ